MVNWMSRLLVSWKGSSPNSGLELDLYLFVKLIHPVLNHWHQNRATKRTKCLWITQDVQDFGSVLGNQCSKSWPHSFPSCWLTLFFLPNVFALNFPRLHFRFHLHFQLYIYIYIFTCSTSSTYYPPFSTFTSTYTSTFFLCFLLFFFCACWNKYCEPHYHVASFIWIFAICRPGHGACTCCR